MGDVKGWEEEMKDVKTAADKDELMKKMSKGEFTLRDLYKQFEDQLMVTPMSKLIGQGLTEDNKKQLKKFMTIVSTIALQILSSTILSLFTSNSNIFFTTI